MGICLSIIPMSHRLLDFFLSGVILLSVVLFVVRPSVQSAAPVPIAAVENPPLTRPQHKSSLPTADSQAFYQTIIDANIFRPLGWRVSTPAPTYHLLGTTIYENQAQNQAVIVNTRTNALHISRTGDKIEDAIVTYIASKEVILQDKDKQIRLSCGVLSFY